MNGAEGTVDGWYPPEGEDELSYDREAPPDHARGFHHALEDALRNWDHDGERNATVTFSARVKKVNPGWILRYGAHLTPNP
jgi:hypothetical protein